MQLVVAVVGRAHGLRGEVALEVRTDRPQQRLAPGTALSTQAGALLVVEQTRQQQGRWYARFEGVADRSAAEALRGVTLLADDEAEAEEDAWYPHELAGLRAELTDGTVVGQLVGLEHAPAHDLLVLRENDGARTLVPFVRAIVPVVDVPGGRVVLDPPGGLLAADAARLVVSPETTARTTSGPSPDDEG